MSYLVLARKYRPQTFDQVVGQDHVSTTLRNAIIAERVAHAMLFTGPRGTGKTTIARILAKSLNCIENNETPYIPCNECKSCSEITTGHDVDVFEIDGASNNSVEQVRELRENITYRPVHSKFKIYIIDEVHMLSLAAFNALLKTLEEPPAHVIFLFATTDPQKIPVTILSRCQRHDLRRIDLSEILSHMEHLCKKESVEIEKKSLELIGFESGGSMRDALSLLDQILSCSKDSVKHDIVVDLLGIFDRSVLFDFSSAIMERDIQKTLFIIENLYKKGNNFVKLYSEIIVHLRNLLVVKLSGKSESLIEVPIHEIEMLAEQVKKVSHTYLSQILDILLKEEQNLKFAASPKIAFEMIFIKLFQISPTLSIEELIKKIDSLKGKIVVNQAPATSEVSIPEKKIEKIKRVENSDRPVDSTKREDKVKVEKAVREEPKVMYNEKLGLERNWEVFLNIISKKHPSVSPSLSKSTLKNVTEKSIEIAVSGTSFNISRIQSSSTKSIIGKALTGFFGKPMDFTVSTKTVSEGKNKDQRRADNIKQTILTSPPVSEIVDIFNGKVVDVKIKEK
ncbi:MAG: DNA polymerase III subunit gamma/tau [Desulfobacterales bacterium]|nr:DNA polymerase III subunit gamma/tau [Desulfobacterales bacterium]MCP4158968.1 DNA polymerase III subunit gamma/tau [Deltaproteobacteria bacterium]